MSANSASVGKVYVNGKSCYALRLAPELLAMIFHEVMAQNERAPILLLPAAQKSHPEENEVHTKPLHTLAHVCRYWRDFALGMPAFWRRIHGRCHDQMEIFLERSRPLPVTLFLDVDHWGAITEEPLPVPMVSVIKAHAMRLRRLDLSVVPVRELIAPLLTALRAPHLETLTITSPYTYSSSRADIMTRELLLNGETLSLKALALMPIVNWIPSCTPFPNLTHLFVSFDREPGLGHPFDVLQLLSNTPALMFLHVDFLLHDASSSGSWRPPSEPIPLLCLRSLVFITCSHRLMHAVLSRLLLPEDVFIRLQDVISEDDSEEYYPAPGPTIALCPVTSLDIDMGGDDILMVADGPTSGLWFEAHHLIVAQQPLGWEAWLRSLPQRLALSHVTYLHIYLEGKPAFFPGLVAELPLVSHLAILLGESTPSTADFDITDTVLARAFSPLAILCRALSPSKTGSSTHVRCPALHALTIEWQERITFGAMGMFPRFPEMLAARARAGYPVRRVVVQAEPLPLSSDAPGVTALDTFRDFAEMFSRGDTEYEVVGRENGAKGLCAFEMRNVWKVEGEDRYWEVDDYEKPRYVLPRRS